MVEDKLFSGESINVEYKLEVPRKNEKYMKTVVAFANGHGGRILWTAVNMTDQFKIRLTRHFSMFLKK